MKIWEPKPPGTIWATPDSFILLDEVESYTYPVHLNHGKQKNYPGG